jgi:hypothetical protein
VEVVTVAMFNLILFCLVLQYLSIKIGMGKDYKKGSSRRKLAYSQGR